MPLREACRRVYNSLTDSVTVVKSKREQSISYSQNSITALVRLVVSAME